MIGVNFYIWNPSTCDLNHLKLAIIWILMTVHPKKTLFGKLISTCWNDILNIIETSLGDNKVTCKKIITLFTQFHW